MVNWERLRADSTADALIWIAFVIFWMIAQVIGARKKQQRRQARSSPQPPPLERRAPVINEDLRELIETLTGKRLPGGAEVLEGEELEPDIETPLPPIRPRKPAAPRPAPAMKAAPQPPPPPPRAAEKEPAAILPDAEAVRRASEAVRRQAIAQLRTVFPRCRIGPAQAQRLPTMPLGGDRQYRHRVAPSIRRAFADRDAIRKIVIGQAVLGPPAGLRM
jgi:hypothetical protein